MMIKFIVLLKLTNLISHPKINATVTLDDYNTISNIEFLGGCPGNQIGIKQLVEGQDAKSISEKLTGIICGARCTSCPDQLAKALKENI